MLPTAKTHSKIGIASCVIGTAMFLLFAVSSLALYFQIGRDNAVLLELFVTGFLPIPVYTSGLILGAVSVFFPNRKKLFPILGIVGNLIFGLIGLLPWLWLIIASMGRV